MQICNTACAHPTIVNKLFWKFGIKNLKDEFENNIYNLWPNNTPWSICFYNL